LEIAVPVRRVLVTDYAWPDLDIERAVLARAGAEIVVAQTGVEPELLDIAPSVDAIVTCWKMVSAAVLQAAARCVTVARAGVGTDNIDVAAASALGMVVTRVPDYCVEDVAEHTLALILALSRQIVPLAEQTRAGDWDNRSFGAPRRLSGRVLGLVGFGRIGRAVAERAIPFGMEVRTWTRRPPADLPPGVEHFAALDQLLSGADIVSLHLPLAQDTRQLIDARRLALMKNSAVLVNTSRGSLVDEAALTAALERGQLGGAALDVLEREPPPSPHLARLPGVIVTPHAAFYSDRSIPALQRRTATNVADVLEGRLPASDYVVDPEVLTSPGCRMRREA
jgi:D-3-phosphoglycerate dehydrogenase